MRALGDVMRELREGLRDVVCEAGELGVKSGSGDAIWERRAGVDGRGVSGPSRRAPLCGW